jgi:predicted nicotinamide N-methyase
MSLPEQKTAEPEFAPWLIAMAELVQRETEPTRLPNVPEIALRLAVETAPLWQKIERDLKLRYGPPYWAVAWAAGLALARHVIDHPALVAGRRVLDFAAGSGIVAIAAAKAGAARVVANDVDPLAVIAISLNADLNGVAIEAIVDDLMPADSDFDPAAFDVVLVADIFYAPELAARALSFLARCHAAGCEVVIGDPGRADLPVDRLEKVSSHAVPVTSDCQFFGAQPPDASPLELRAANVWRFAR